MNTRKLKRLIPLVLAIVLMMSSLSFANPINVYVNDGKLDMPVQPISQDGRTLVPLRSIFESMGASVDWDQATKTVTGIKDNKEIKLQLGNKTATIDGKSIELDVPATAINGSTLVPTRFVAESLGSKVDWDGNTRSVLVDSKHPFGKYKVTRVVDGDTLKVNFNGKEESLRLIGIDTPESVHPDASKNVPAGKVASDYVKSKLEGKEIAIEFDVQERDHYGRLLGYVWFNGQMFNKTLVEEGYATVATYPPNVKHVDDFTKLQAEAKNNKKGFWKDGGFEGSTQIEEPARKTDGLFVGSIKSDIYHKKTCTHAKKITDSNIIGFDSIQEASDYGYVPCKVCKPQ